ncbi:MAG: hypothetical protein UV73_C0002G0141 [Candidatus Gottesmanbacteria bacterium GW2011_GWA2_43_14]|uniref:Uncharacterized protein n=1 Tax=Candidatus Gottesmanbacteria bacterium GW2011_GWA2_43_14 TaxID=1618443 RepID=A0A0G1DLG0_9BACT|nr:MAG: hypothetical protein UV73_C0002G0141 [Candidatus Gottesmanbacteria bacterium GW2011_GWA2_43_14]
MKKRLFRLIIFSLLFIAIILYINGFKTRIGSDSPELNLELETKEDLSAKAKDMTKKFINGNDIIKKIITTGNCDLSASCLEIVNQDRNWLGSYNQDYPVTLNNNNLLKLTFKNSESSAGIHLISRYGGKNELWWKNRVSLNLAVLKELFSVYLDTGTQEEPLLLFSQTINTDTNGLASVYIIFDRQGKIITFADSFGSFSKKVNIAKDVKSLSQGLFPENKLHLGVFVAPLSKLTLTELYLFPFE